jgi:hypothetical protein
MDAYRAHRMHFETRAERFQPVVGMMFAGGSVLWMLNSAPGGIGALLLSFVFFWGVFLVLRRVLLRILYFLTAAWKMRGFSYEESLRFFDEGYSRSDSWQTHRVGWGNVRNALFSTCGITLLSDDDKTYLISSRAAPATEYASVQLFLREKFVGVDLKKAMEQ